MSIYLGYLKNMKQNLGELRMMGESAAKEGNIEGLLSVVRCAAWIQGYAEGITALCEDKIDEKMLER